MNKRSSLSIFVLFLLLVSLLPVSPTSAQNEIVIQHYGVTYIFNSTSVTVQTSNESFSFSLLYNNLKQSYNIREVDIEQNRYIIYEYSPNFLGVKTGVWANITFAFLKYSPLCKITFSISNVGSRTKGQGFPFVLNFDKNLKQKGSRLKLGKLFFDFGDAVSRSNKTGRFSVSSFSNKVGFEVLSDEEIDPTVGTESGIATNQVVQYSYPTVPAVFGNGINGSLTISANTAWTKAGNYYNFTDLTINSGVTLTVSPGVIIRVSGTLTVYGTISADGKGGAGGYGIYGASGSNGPATDAVGGSGGKAGNYGNAIGYGGSYGGGGGSVANGPTYQANGGSYGGGGGSSDAAAGQAIGGNGGGIITIYGRTINIASGAVITASGTSGTVSASGVAAGGGGGGRIYIYAGSGGYSNSGTLQAIGGNGAWGGGGGGAGCGGGGGYIKVTAPSTVTIGATNVAGGSGAGYNDPTYYTVGASSAGSTATATDTTLADTSSSGSSTTTYAYYYAYSSSNTTWRWDFSYSFPSGASSRSLSVTFPKGHQILNVTAVSDGTALTTSQFSVSVYNTTHYLLTIPEATIAAKGSSYKLFTSSVNYIYQILKDGSYYSPSSTLNFNIQIKDATGTPIANQKISSFITDANFATIYASSSALSSANGWFNGSFTVPSTEGTYYLRANTTGGVFYLTFKVSRIKLSSWTTLKNRVNVGSSPTVASGTAQFTVDSSNVASGTIYINGTAVPISNGAFSWSYSSSVVKNYSIYTTGVSSDKVTTLDQTYSGWVVFDKVNVTSFTFKTHRLNVSQALPSLTANLVYEYDNSSFVGSYTLNDSSHSTVGKYWYKIASISDSKYGLTVFDQKVFDYLIFDKWNLTLSAPSTRVPANSNATVYVNGKSLYDGTAWQGKVNLNINPKQPLGTYTFFIKNITDNLFNVTSFINNTVTVKFDALKVSGLKFNGYNPDGSFNFSITDVRFATDNVLANSSTINVNGVNFTLYNFKFTPSGNLIVKAVYEPTYKVSSPYNNLTWVFSNASVFWLTTKENKTFSGLYYDKDSKTLVFSVVNATVYISNCPQPYLVKIDGYPATENLNYTYDPTAKILKVILLHSTGVVYFEPPATGAVGGGGGGGSPYSPLAIWLPTYFVSEEKTFFNNKLAYKIIFVGNNTSNWPLPSAYMKFVLPKEINSFPVLGVFSMNDTKFQYPLNFTHYSDAFGRVEVGSYVITQFNLLKDEKRYFVVIVEDVNVKGNIWQAPLTILGITLQYGTWLAIFLAIIGFVASYRKWGWAGIGIGIGIFAIVVVSLGVSVTLATVPASPEDWFTSSSPVYIPYVGRVNLAVQDVLLVLFILLIAGILVWRKLQEGGGYAMA